MHLYVDYVQGPSHTQLGLTGPPHTPYILTVLTRIRDRRHTLQPALSPSSPPSLFPPLPLSLYQSSLPGDSGLERAAPAHVHIQPGVRGQSLAILPAHSQPLSGHLPISCGTDFLGVGVRVKGGLPCLLTQSLPLLAGLFIPPGTSKAPPITGSGIPTKSSEALPLPCFGRTEPGQITPLHSILQCFPFSPQKPQHHNGP